MKKERYVDKILSQKDIHRFFLKTGVVIAAFFVTSILSQLYNIASNEYKLDESKAVAQVKVDFYKNKENLEGKEKLNYEIAAARLGAVKKEIDTHNSIIELNKSVSGLCMGLSPLFLFIGLLFWFLHLPYVHVNTQDDE